MVCLSALILLCIDRNDNDLNGCTIIGDLYIISIKSLPYVLGTYQVLIFLALFSASFLT